MCITRTVSGLCLVWLLVSASAVGQARAPKGAQTSEVAKPAPDFELRACDGRTYQLSDHKDKIVVLEWWNQDCPVTRHYTPTMKALATKHTEKGVIWLAIDSTHYQTAAKDAEYHRKHGIPYPILMDTDGKVGRLYDARTTPHMFVINKGVIAYNGAIDNRRDRNYVAEALAAVLAGKEVSLALTQPFGCSVKYGKPAPDFELRACDGKTYKLSDYSDKVVVLEWWNQDCPVSRHYMPTMKELAAKYAVKGVIWLAIDSTHYQTAAKDAEYHRKNGIPYPILMDTDGNVGRLYEAKTTPHMFVINKGVVVYDGAIDNQGDRNYVVEALAAVLASQEIPLAKTQPFGCSVKYQTE
ncbi:MAG: redoxin domain-containing protein [Phycisphaerae bacterium]